jgi:hypothetical protein
LVSDPSGIKDTGVIIYQFFIDSGGVVLPGNPQQALSYCIGVIPQSASNHGALE